MNIFNQLATQFLQTSLLEWFAVITGFVCIYLAAKQHILNWPISMFSILAYSVLFYEGKLYGEMLLQGYFLFTAIYGWYYWIKRKQEHKKPVVSFSVRNILYSLLAIGILSIGLGSFLYHFTDTDVAYIDGTLASVSFVAQFLMTRKVLQNWLLWIVVDVFYIPLFIYKGFFLTAILYAVLVLIAWEGYKDWKKTWRTNQ
ncbi:nicotinamide mononucleotide transporter [Olivibacter sp. SDN3]|uniref:nicotinamide riboside transporter PnuC n=1 Tax=Olivibacter sp. SDN3 TaxID=2764720 RepID=UPI00165191B4|nr:nicotinamide riboside transporter PnuC [Olivibacter sp. SDN3]QNL50855.1 nicotinamide mononucleotide transporter [Olivibacter sp. SDN3]